MWADLSIASDPDHFTAGVGVHHSGCAASSSHTEVRSARTLRERRNAKPGPSFHPIDSVQFIQNRNTFRLRVDYDWLQNGKLIDRFEIPFIERSKLFLLYRGVYDGFYDIAPGRPATRADALRRSRRRADSWEHHRQRSTPTATCSPGNYSRLTEDNRSSLKWENALREAYIDLKIKDAPLSFRIGRQQVIWGESDQFRIMDIWNPLDTSWHFQQESWDNIRVPLWLMKGLWDIGQVGPLSNTFLEVVYNAFDFQPGHQGRPSSHNHGRCRFPTRCAPDRSTLTVEGHHR